jgi:hypothetical protein
MKVNASIVNTTEHAEPKIRHASRIGALFKRIGDLPQFLIFFVLGLAPGWAQAGILSSGICRPYRQLVDNELFLMVSIIAAAILVIAWKLAPSGAALSKGVGLLAALFIGLNIENILQAATGAGIAC